MSFAATAGAISIASSDASPGALVFAVIAWAFVGGMSLADLIIPVAHENQR